MEKIQQLEERIRQAVHLNLQAQNPRRQAADSKEHDDRPLEAGLSVIGQALQRGENQIAEIFAEYERGSSKAATVAYPKHYQLKTDKERREEALELDELGNRIPSKTFRRNIKKSMVEKIYGHRLPMTELEVIFEEIDKAETLCVKPDDLFKAQEQGLVDKVTASDALGFDGAKVIPIATKEHAEHLAEIQKAQSTGFNTNRGTDPQQPGVQEPQRGEANS
jgi:hypothetical protein